MAGIVAGEIYNASDYVESEDVWGSSFCNCIVNGAFYVDDFSAHSYSYNSYSYSYDMFTYYDNSEFYEPSEMCHMYISARRASMLVCATPPVVSTPRAIELMHILA